MKHQSQSSKLTGSLDASDSASTLEMVRDSKPNLIDYAKAKQQWDQDTKDMTLSQKFVHAMKIMDLPHWK